MAEAERIVATYRLAVPAAAAAARAEALALEQSVELPLEAVHDPQVRARVVGRVLAVRRVADHVHEADIALAAETTGHELGQLMNMLFGNASLQEDVTLADVAFPQTYVHAFTGPRHGLAAWRRLTGAHGRPLACAALKPQGLPVSALAALAGALAAAGIDVVKDDHGLADQRYSRFADRVAACQAAITAANRARSGHTLYAPSLSGSFEAMLRQVDVARESGVQAYLIAPMVCGLANAAVIAARADAPVMAHPALAGAARIAPPLLLGKLFRLAGFDAVIFPNAGGRFSYAESTCDAIVEAARGPWHGCLPMLPVPAGGMSLERVPGIVERYGADCMLLLGGTLLRDPACIAERARAFVDAMRQA